MEMMQGATKEKAKRLYEESEMVSSGLKEKIVADFHPKEADD